MDQKPERVIYLKDLLFAVLYRWKWMVLLAVIFGLLLGGMEYFSDETEIMNTTAIVAGNQMKIDNHRQNLDVAEVGIKAQSEYLENSVLMSLDGYAAYTAGFHLYPCPSAMKNVPEGTVPYDNTSRILRAYAVFVGKTETVQALADEFGMEPKYMAELVRSSISGVEAVAITVRGATPEDAAELADAVRRLIEAQKATVDSTIEPHDLTIIEFQTGPRVDSDLQNAQKNAQQRLSNLRNQWVSSVVALEKLTPTELLNGDKSYLLMVAVGVVVGMFLVAAVVVVAQLASSKVYSARALKDQTNLTLLGCICSSRKRGPVIRWLRRLEGRSAYEQLDVVTVNLRNRCDGIKELLVMGCYEEKDLAPLTKSLEENGIHCKLCGDPGNSAKTLELLKDCDGVVLVETCGSSSYDSIHWTIETVADYNKKLLGCVLIDG